MPQNNCEIRLALTPLTCGKLKYPETNITWLKNSSFLLNTMDVEKYVYVYPIDMFCFY